MYVIHPCLEKCQSKVLPLCIGLLSGLVFSFQLFDNIVMKKPIIFSVLFFILILIKCYSLEDVGCEQKADKQLQPNTIAIGHDAPDFQVELLGSKLLKLSDHVKKCEGPTILLFARAHW